MLRNKNAIVFRKPYCSTLGIDYGNFLRFLDYEFVSSSIAARIDTTCAMRWSVLHWILPRLSARAHDHEQRYRSHRADPPVAGPSIGRRSRGARQWRINDPFGTKRERPNDAPKG